MRKGNAGRGESATEGAQLHLTRTDLLRSWTDVLESPIGSPVEPPSVWEMQSYGKEILNCITLWFPGYESVCEAHTSPVAVIASNDKSIYVVNLDTLAVLQQITHPEPINLGMISPDGSVLIVIGDDPFMYVYKRRGCRLSKSDNEWHEYSKVHLPGQKISDRDEMRGSFAASFSHRFLALGTQYGEVVIFEQQELKQSKSPRPKDAFRSTRPNTRCGAIRALHFNPCSSLDLLAITEDNGRVVTVDVRQLYKRQVIDTDLSGDVDIVNLQEDYGERVEDPALDADMDSTDDESAYPDHPLTRQERIDARIAQRERQNQRLLRELDATFEGASNVGWLPDEDRELEVLRALTANRRRREEARRHQELRLSAPNAELPDPVPDDNAIGRSTERSRDLDATLAAHVANRRRQRSAAPTGENLLEPGALGLPSGRLFQEWISSNRRSSVRLSEIRQRFLDRAGHVERSVDLPRFMRLPVEAEAEGSADAVLRGGATREAYSTRTLPRPVPASPLPGNADARARLAARSGWDELDILEQRVDEQAEIANRQARAEGRAQGIEEDMRMVEEASQRVAEHQRARDETLQRRSEARRRILDRQAQDVEARRAEQMPVVPRRSRAATLLTDELAATRRQQVRGWLPREQVYPPSVRQYSYNMYAARGWLTHKNQTTGCAWSPNGRIL